MSISKKDSKYSPTTRLQSITISQIYFVKFSLHLYREIVTFYLYKKTTLYKCQTNNSYCISIHIKIVWHYVYIHQHEKTLNSNTENKNSK